MIIFFFWLISIRIPNEASVVEMGRLNPMIFVHTLLFVSIKMGGWFVWLNVI